MAKKNNIREIREQKKMERKAKFIEQQTQREKQKIEAEDTAKKEQLRKESVSKQSAKDKNIKSAAKAAGVKSVFAVNDAIYMTSFGKGNDAVLEKKIVSDSHENMNKEAPAFILTDVNNTKYKLSSSRIKSLEATSDNPVHRKKGKDDKSDYVNFDHINSDMLMLKGKLEQKFYGETFGNDNIHIQLIYNILDVEKILAQYSTNAVYALNNLFREKQSESRDIFSNMTTDYTYNDICYSTEYKKIDIKNFIDLSMKNPRLAYFGSAFLTDNGKRKSLRNEEDIYDIFTLIGKLRHWCVHGNDENSVWLYKLDSLSQEFRDIMDKLYNETIKNINHNFINTNKVNIQILASVYPEEKLSKIIREYYSFVVTKSYKNIGFSIKKLREIMVEDTAIKDKKYDSVRSKLYKLIDFIIWHGYENEDKSETDRLVNELRGSRTEDKKQEVYNNEAKRLWTKHENTILNDVVQSVDGNNIKELQKNKLNETDIGNGLIKEAKNVSYFTKLMYLLTLFIDGKEINDLLTTLINKFDNIRSFNETMKELSLTTKFVDDFAMFNDSGKILGELKELNSFARMCPADISAKRIMYEDALDILGIETNMTDSEFQKFLDKLLCLDANGNPIKDKKLKDSGLRNFIANNVIDSVRFRYLIRYGDPKRIKKLSYCEPAVKFVLKGIPDTQIERYYDSCRNLRDKPAFSSAEKRTYLAQKIKEMSFEKIENAGKVQKANVDRGGKSAEEKEKYKALVRLYLTVMYLMLKNLVNVNSRYVIGFHCLERDAALYGVEFKQDTDRRNLTFKIMDVFDAVNSGTLTGKCDIEKAEKAGNRHLKNKKWYEIIYNNLQKSDKKTTAAFRNAAAHLNAIMDIDENIKGIAYVNNYFELYHYIVQRYLQKKLGNSSQCSNVYFEMLDKNKSYVKDFVKAYCTPMAYSLVRYKNLTIDGLFDKNREDDDKSRSKNPNNLQNF